MKKLFLIFLILGTLQPLTFAQSNIDSLKARITILKNKVTKLEAKPIDGIPRAYYFSNSGNDTFGVGTIRSPFQTLTKVNSLSLSGGDSILFKGGQTFPGYISKILFLPDTNTIVVSSYGTGKAKILMPDFNKNDGISIQTVYGTRILIQNLIVEGQYNAETQTGGDTSTTVSHSGINVVNYSPIGNGDNRDAYFTIRNCEVRNIKNWGIVAQGGGNTSGRKVHMNINSNYVHDIGTIGIMVNYVWRSNLNVNNNVVSNIKGFQSVNGYTGTGIQMSENNLGLVEKNLIYSCGKFASISGMGINLGNSNQMTIRRNEIYDIVNNGNNLVESYPHDAWGIDFEVKSDSGIAEYNYIHNTDGVGIGTTGGNYNTIRYNILKDCGRYSDLMAIFIGGDPSLNGVKDSNNSVYNNTIVQKKSTRGPPFRPVSTGYGISVYPNKKNCLIANNIILGDSIIPLTVGMSGQVNFKLLNNIYWDRNNNPTFDAVISDLSYPYPTIRAFVDYYGLEKINGASILKQYDPGLRDAWNPNIDTLNNPGLIETLTKFDPLTSSPAADLGLDLGVYPYNLKLPTKDIKNETFSDNPYNSIGAIEAGK